MPPAFLYQWDGEAMRLHPRFGKEADQAFVIGATYALAEVLERSSASHRHYFAAIREAWLNLPEELSPQFPSDEHLRKHALIRAGYFDLQTTVCQFKTEARRLAAFIRPQDDYALVIVSGKVVNVYRAKSQSLAAMGKEVFQQSKDKVLEILAEMIGVEQQDLTQHARAA